MSKLVNQLASGLFAATVLASPLWAESIPPADLAEQWSFYGDGSRAAQNRMFYLEESPGSQGVMVVSPRPYSGDLTLRYEIMPMSAASVCVVLLFASDPGEADTLSLPENYDGGMAPWTDTLESYFFAFHNAAHDRTPFAVKFPAKVELGQATENVVRSGEFSTIEIRRRGETLTFAVNGTVLFEGRDPEPLRAGHLAFRVRGIPQQPASCLIRNVTVEADAPAEAP